LVIYRIRTWDKYEELALKFKPSIIYYARDPHPLRNPSWGLKLIFYNGFDSYLFIDYSDEHSLHKTKIPIKGTDEKEIPLLVEDIEKFLYSRIGRVKISPIWFVS
jgi:hypothetical protein